MIASLDSNVAIQTFIGTISLLITLEFTIGFLDFLLKDKVIYSQMLQRIYRELTLMGLISFGIVMVTASGNGHDSPYLAGIDFAHYLLFFTVICFVGHSFYLMYTSRKASAQYLSFERMDDAELLEDIKSHSLLQRVMFSWRYLPWVSHNRECVEYKILERIFKDAYWLPEEFDFASYLTHQFEHHALKTMDINMFNWLVLISLVCINYARSAFQLGFNCSPNDASYSNTFADKASGNAARMLSAGGETFDPACTRMQLYLMSICSFLLFLYACVVLTFARYYELKLLERAGVKSVSDYVPFLSLLASDSAEREHADKLWRQQHPPKDQSHTNPDTNPEILQPSSRMTLTELSTAITDVFDAMESGDAEERIYASLGKALGYVWDTIAESLDGGVKAIKGVSRGQLVVSFGKSTRSLDVGGGGKMTSAQRLAKLLADEKQREEEEKEQAEKKDDNERAVKVVTGMLRSRRWIVDPKADNATSGGAGGASAATNAVSKVGPGGLTLATATSSPHKTRAEPSLVNKVLAPSLIDKFREVKRIQNSNVNSGECCHSLSESASDLCAGIASGLCGGRLTAELLRKNHSTASTPGNNSNSGGGGGSPTSSKVAPLTLTEGDEELGSRTNTAATFDLSEGGARQPSPSASVSPAPLVVLPPFDVTPQGSSKKSNDLSDANASTKKNYAKEQPDFKSVFIGARPKLFYNSVDVCIMFCCFYLAMWATNFVTLTEAIPTSRVLWDLILITPVFFVLQLLAMINKTVSLLHAVCTLDLRLARLSVDETLEMHEVMAEMREHTLAKVREIFTLDSLDSKLDLVDTLYGSIDDGDGEIDETEFRGLLRSLSLRYSNERFRKLYRAIDRDGGGSIEKGEYFALLFPSDEYTEERRPHDVIVRDARNRKLQGALLRVLSDADEAFDSDNSEALRGSEQGQEQGQEHGQGQGQGQEPATETASKASEVQSVQPAQPAINHDLSSESEGEGQGKDKDKGQWF